MTLYCYRCRAIHEFTPTQVERILYCLQAQTCDYLVCPPDTRPDDTEDAFSCLKGELALSDDLEGYAEFTDMLIEARQMAIRTQRKAATR